MSEANKTQVGGTHYRTETGEQHWDRIWRLHGRGYFVGCATKYIERYHLKNGIEDLRKAAHFLQKLIELEQAALDGPLGPPNPYTETLPAPASGESISVGGVAVRVAADGYCVCDSGATCPLGNTGLEPRCSRGELEDEAALLALHRKTRTRASVDSLRQRGGCCDQWRDTGRCRCLERAAP